MQRRFTCLSQHLFKHPYLAQHPLQFLYNPNTIHCSCKCTGATGCTIHCSCKCTAATGCTQFKDLKDNIHCYCTHTHKIIIKKKDPPHNIAFQFKDSIAAAILKLFQMTISAISLMEFNIHIQELHYFINQVISVRQ